MMLPMAMTALASGGGATAGAAGAGGFGALAGGALGAGGSMFDSMSSNKAKKKQQKEEEEAKQSLPGHKKLSRVFDSINAWQEKKLQSMATLSQAAMDWAAMMR